MRAVIVPASVARRAVAACWLDGLRNDDDSLGSVVLRPHQRRAVTRLRRALDRHGGALLADDVGLGKTYVALALARDACAPLVVAPAALRGVWRDAAARCGVTVRFASFESLSRGGTIDDTAARGADLLVVDEAHHARNPATRRWRRLATLAAGARVLLLSATPVHNSARDLHALFSLFLGEHAAHLDGAALLRLVVRRCHADLDPTRGSSGALGASLAMPVVGRARWRTLPADRAVGRALRAIPPPLPTAGGGTGGMLWRLGLVRAWASSDGALRAALRRRLGVAAALESALDAGRLPTRRDLRAWTPGDDAMQLALPLLVTDTSAGAQADAWRDVVRAHAAGVCRALDVLASRPDRDARRAGWLRAVRRRHAGASVVAFTQSADTARALYRRLAGDGGVALLTAAGGRVAGGPLGRAELLARFAPIAAGVPPPPAAERATLLIATDCLSEGLDLRDASVVVHLDVPWTHARLAQRVGRAARLGAPNAVIHVHGLAPPAGAERWLRLATRLRTKAAAARRAVGGAARGTEASDAQCAARLARRLERWCADGGALGSATGQTSGGPLVATVTASRRGFLAACVDAHGPLLVAGDRGRLSDAPAALLRAVRRAARATDCDSGGLSNPWSCATAAAAWRRIRRWHAAAHAARSAGLDESPGALAARVLARVDEAMRHSPSHRRAACAALAAEVRGALRHPLPVATETAVARLLAAPADEAWLRAITAATNGRLRDDRDGGELRLVALVVWQPEAMQGVM